MQTHNQEEASLEKGRTLAIKLPTNPGTNIREVWIILLYFIFRVAHCRMDAVGREVQGAVSARIGVADCMKTIWNKMKQNETKMKQKWNKMKQNETKMKQNETFCSFFSRGRSPRG
jgi:hypothetical protein